ncbi:hypothetical protein M8756_13330 [Lutimaribacter sp. EGI FJ00015]|uniref:Uncharacterized protein n=1 Tax=Lutimaribacter degradans TaxID=2945989 RepID=A0ACC5ZYG5_9RHOB|nr:hypothetical protein [Lutimaribacter sp. EGI FJ00013]MCM2563116.1 hypothetical protein [Lutimaribacter sp. EGI FJ00013]MCO0614295.1 hypothetical protein [Lutimaribacter sp. EGI FJ00015]MCO0637105.1 hypothetical protein [Lutimaribacter sp. EGI FJ00014]
MPDYGPTRGELKFRLGFSAAGLILLAAALALHGVKGLAWLEIALIAGGFFGGSFCWSALKLWRGEG